MANRIDKEIISVQSYIDKHFNKFLSRAFFAAKDGEHWPTYAEAKEEIYSLAKGLMAKGYTGKHIAVMSENCYEFLKLFYASMLAGVVTVPVNLATEPPKIAEMLHFADVSALFATNKTNPLADGIKGFLPLVSDVVLLDSTEGENTLEAITELGRREEEKEYFGSFDDDRTAMICFTSGTTGGKPKGVMLTAKNLLAAAKYQTHTYKAYVNGDTEESVIHTPLPFFHLAGIICTVTSEAIPTGSTIATCKSPMECFEDFRRVDPGYTIIVPALAEAMYGMVMSTVKAMGDEEAFAEYTRECMEGKYTFEERREKCRKYTAVLGKNLRGMAVCGAMSDVTIIDRFAILGVHIGCDYGLTECSPQVTLAEYPVPQPLGSVGVACDFNELKIEGGVLYVKGDNVMKGYYKNPEATSEALSEDGWLCTGDLAAQDENGFIYIKGRATSVVVLSNGDNIDTDELTLQFCSSPAISEMIILADKKNNNDTLGALIYAPEGTSYDDVKAEVTRINATLPIQKRIIRFRMMDKPFEKNPMMKIKRFMYLKEEI